MKLSIISILSLAFVATAIPSGADYSLVGFAKDNPIGPTTGGAGKKSQTITVSSVEALVSAVAGTEPKVIYAKGKFNLTSRLRPGSNKVLNHTDRLPLHVLTRNSQFSVSARVPRSLEQVSQLSMRQTLSCVTLRSARLSTTMASPFRIALAFGLITTV